MRKNMKNKLMNMQEKLRLKNRGNIESALDIMMTVCDIDYTRHRSSANAYGKSLCRIKCLYLSG
ncbi:MAG: transposase [Bacteroidia bacterium]